MESVTQPLRDEHRELVPHIEALRQIADMIGEIGVADLRQNVGNAYAFLVKHLIPHAKAEDEALYPLVNATLGTSQATATMSRDHVEVERLTAELAALRPALEGPTINATQTKALRRVLYGLYALLTVHFAKEEEIYLPLLEAHLTAEEAQRMFTAMEAAAARAKQQAESV